MRVRGVARRSRRLQFESLECRRLLAGHDMLATAILVSPLAPGAPSLCRLATSTRRIRSTSTRSGARSMIRWRQSRRAIAWQPIDSYIRIFNSAASSRSTAVQSISEQRLGLGIRPDWRSVLRRRLRFIQCLLHPTTSGSGSGGASSGMYNLQLTLTAPTPMPRTLATARRSAFPRHAGLRVGRYRSTNDADLYKLSLLAGDSLQLAVSAQSIGSPLPAGCECSARRAMSWIARPARRAIPA